MDDVRRGALRAVWLPILALLFGLIALTPRAPARVTKETVKRRPLLGETDFSAKRPSWAPVRIRSKTTIRTPFGATRDVSVRGGGDVVVFALVQEKEDPFVLLGGRLPRAAGGTTFALPLSNLPERSGWNYDIAKNYRDVTEIPPGIYRLYLFPGGRKASLRLKLAGLSGTTSLRRTRPASFTVRSPAPRLTTGDTMPNVYSAGSSEVLDGEGLMFNVLWLRSEPYVAGQFEFCHYRGDSEIEPLAYAPGCPNARQTSTVNNRRSDVGENTRVLYGGNSSLPAERHGQGFWYAAEAVVKEIGYMSLWLSYA